eukprot:348412_1
MCLSPTSPKSPMSPMSPKSPVYPSYASPLADDAFDIDDFKTKHTPSDILARMGFSNLCKITDTLQGTIWRATNYLNQRVVIKTTNRYLHSNAMSKINGQTMRHVQENIQLEQSILKFLTQNDDCPSSIVKFDKFFETSDHFYLVMEDGGNSLFEFIKKAHGLIKNGNISLEHWQAVIRVILKQMMECVAYIHSKNVCHFDISLENWLINDVEVVVKTTRGKKKSQSEQLTFVIENIQVKLCDFGLAEIFTSEECKSSKFVGKESYASPEVVENMKGFDAKKNDIWCVGVCLFMIATGLAPFNTAHKSDPSFIYMLEYGAMDKVLCAW